MGGESRAVRMIRYPGPNVCRLCMRNVPTMPIYPDKGQNVEQKINTVFPFKVSINDPYPKNICFQCLEKLNFTYEFMMGMINCQPERIRALRTPYDELYDF